MLEQTWHVYMIQTDQDTLYTGITTDLIRRFSEHKSGRKGAKYFRSVRPKKIIYSQRCTNRSEATKLEAKLKKLTQKQKYELVKAHVK